jgi:hypothetical protein
LNIDSSTLSSPPEEFFILTASHGKCNHYKSIPHGRHGDSVSLISIRYIHEKRTGDEMKKKKLNGWLVVGLCIAAMLLAVGVIYLIGTLG